MHASYNIYDIQTLTRLRCALSELENNIFDVHLIICVLSVFACSIHCIVTPLCENGDAYSDLYSIC